jgi:hypothetical protein
MVSRVGGGVNFENQATSGFFNGFRAGLEFTWLETVKLQWNLFRLFQVNDPEGGRELM